MRYIQVGGTRLSAVGLGTWQFGSMEWGYGTGYADVDAARIVQRAMDLGVNLIDTAEIYGFGRSERIVGKAIASRRADAFVATKIAPFVPFGPVVRNRARGSARRLGVSQVDLYQAHWPNPVFPPGQLFATLAELKAEGLIHHVGVSNYNLEQWKQAEGQLGSPVLSNQVQYSLARRHPEQDVLPWAQAHDRVIIAFSPLAQGFLSAKHTADNRPGGVRAVNTLFLPANLERAAELFDALRSVATSHGATPAQIALAWLIHQPNVVVIPGASSVGQLEANVAAADIELSPGELDDLSGASSRFHPESGAGALPSMVRARLRR